MKTQLTATEKAHCWHGEGIGEWALKAASPNQCCVVCRRDKGSNLQS